MISLAGRRILLTGGSGFLGGHVHEELLGRRPGEVIIPRSSDSDLTQPTQVAALFREHRPEIVIHLAAVVGGIEANRRHPGKFFYDNAVMGLHLLEEARKAGVEKFVSLATICAYPKHTPVPFREDDLWNGYPEETNAPYGLAKKMLLVQAQAYRQEYGFSAITLFPVNLYGPRDNFDPTSSHVIPALIRKTIEARDEGRPSIDVWGTGAASREFLFVRDAARAILLATERYDEPEPINLGSGKEISIVKLAETIRELCGYQGEFRWDSRKPDGQPRRCLDVTRAFAAFGFRAETTLATGLAETIRWFEEHRAQVGAGDFTPSWQRAENASSTASPIP